MNAVKTILKATWDFFETIGRNRAKRTRGMWY